MKTKQSRSRDPRRRRPLGTAMLVVATTHIALVLGGCRSSSPRSSLFDVVAVGGTSGGAGDTSAGVGGGTADADGAVLFIEPDGATSNTLTADAACGASKIGAEPRVANVLLVVDKSGSMADTPAGFATDKWTALTSAMSTALGIVKNDVSFGLELFPDAADPKNPIPVACKTNCCEMPAAPGIDVPVEAGATSVPKILAAIQGTSPGGGTPTATALARALVYFKSGAGAALQGDKYVLLATDGGPDCNAALSCEAAECTTNLDGQCAITGGGNCCDAVFGGAATKSRCLDDAATKVQVTALFNAGVRTFVVGIPGSEAYQPSLDAFAAAGGEENPSAPPKYFAVTTAGGVTGLTTVLEAITKQLITTCRLELTSVPPVFDNLNVSIDGAVIPQGTNGWQLDATTSPPTIVLTGGTCTRVTNEGVKSVEVLYGCPTLIR